MVTWDEFYDKVKENVTDKLQKEELVESNLIFEVLLGSIVKECLIEDGILMRKEVGRDETRNIPGKSVLYRNDSVSKLTQVRI